MIDHENNVNEWAAMARTIEVLDKTVDDLVSERDEADEFIGFLLAEQVVAVCEIAGAMTGLCPNCIEEAVYDSEHLDDYLDFLHDSGLGFRERALVLVGRLRLDESELFDAQLIEDEDD